MNIMDAVSQRRRAIVSRQTGNSTFRVYPRINKDAAHTTTPCCQPNSNVLWG